MPFQAIAWAWKVPLADPVERCVLLWMAGQCSPGGDSIIDPIRWEELAGFAGCRPDEAGYAATALAEKGLISISADQRAAHVRLPYGSLVQVAEDDWNYEPNTAPIPRELRDRVLSAYRRACFACGSKVEPHVDHIIPRKLGGPNTFENLQVLCADCNTRKGKREGWVP